jgi:hypothetical protein
MQMLKMICARLYHFKDTATPREIIPKSVLMTTVPAANASSPPI